MKKNFEMFSNFFGSVYALFCIFYFIIIANRTGSMLEQYEDFSRDCISLGFIFCYLVFCGVPSLGRTFAFIIKKVKNGNPKAEKGEKGIENGTDDFNRI